MFCGDSYGKNGVNSNACTVPCKGNSSQMCGAGWTNSVYDVSKVSGSISAPSVSVFFNLNNTIWLLIIINNLDNRFN